MSDDEIDYFFLAKLDQMSEDSYDFFLARIIKHEDDGSGRQKDFYMEAFSTRRKAQEQIAEIMEHIILTAVGYLHEKRPRLFKDEENKIINEYIEVYCWNNEYYWMNKHTYNYVALRELQNELLKGKHTQYLFTYEVIGMEIDAYFEDTESIRDVIFNV